MAKDDPAPQAPTRSAIDCGNEIKHQATAVSAAIDILKFASGKFDWGKKKIDALNSEGTVITELMQNFCKLYRVTDEHSYPTSEYRRDLKDVGQWQVDVIAFGNKVHADTAGNTDPDDKDKNENKSIIDKLVDVGKDLVNRGATKTEKHPETEGASKKMKAEVAPF